MQLCGKVNSLKIEVKNLTKEYMQGDQKVTALNNVDFSISKGEFICIMGRSGSGKTTLLNIMAGLTIPTLGNVFLDEADIFTFSDEEISLYRNNKIGFLPQGQSTIANLTVLDNVRLPFHITFHKGDSVEQAREILKLVGIEQLESCLPKRLSGGQIKRVAIARALINNPDFLLVDEPTGDLDEQTTESIMEIFRKVADSGIAVMMITHDSDAEKYADKCFEMSGGVISQKY